MTGQLADVTFQQVQVFLSVGETCHFTKSAQLLNMTQPGISRSLAKLEEILQVTLFERSKRSVVLTPAGQILYDTWKTGYQVLEEGFVEAITAEDELRLGAPFTVNLGKILPPYTKEWTKKYPKHRISVIEEKPLALKDSLNSGKVDLIFVPDSQVYDLDEELFAWRYVAYSNLQVILCKPHPLAKKEQVTMEEALSLPQLVIDPEVNGNFLTYLEECAQEHGKSLRISGYFHSNYELQNMLSGTQSVYLCEEYYAIVLPDDYVKIPVADKCGGVLCVWRRQNPRRSVVQFLKWIERFGDS